MLEIMMQTQMFGSAKMEQILQIVPANAQLPHNMVVVADK